ncbi:hypothetical protein FNV43_RR01376 [Rhamnella rubrinervis]|uniref:H(+)-transporting two-sector ATPase n=1 Tax=Rhamnella rubrinervis TaxID=2594499 RepID=A0A8K0HPI8_9ROSA|nr:hypothetical protein FNV43_RR01376 [Rhamnella rubrinervis]
MPNIYKILVVKSRDTVGQRINLTCKVQQLLENNRVRAVTMSATDGLMRGMEVIVIGAPLSVPADGTTVSERTHEGIDLYMEMKESGVINEQNIKESKVALVYDQINESFGARMRVGLTALTMAEYFRDVNEQDKLVLLTISSFCPSGIQVLALLGRMPFAVGYQPTLSTKMISLQ